MSHEARSNLQTILATVPLLLHVNIIIVFLLPPTEPVTAHNSSCVDHEVQIKTLSTRNTTWPHFQYLHKHKFNFKRHIMCFWQRICSAACLCIKLLKQWVLSWRHKSEVISESSDIQNLAINDTNVSVKASNMGASCQQNFKLFSCYFDQEHTTVAQCQIIIHSVCKIHLLLVTLAITILCCMMPWVLATCYHGNLSLNYLPSHVKGTRHQPFHSQSLHTLSSNLVSHQSQRLQKPSMWIDCICCHWSGNHWPLLAYRSRVKN